MIGKTIVRWLAASGRPAAVTQRETNTLSQKVSSSSDAVGNGNWVTRTIQRNRVFTASGIAVVLFTYGGFAWSARTETRLVRKSADPMSEPDDDFGELLNLPPYTGKGEQLSIRSQDVEELPSPSADHSRTNSQAYDPFDDIPGFGSQTPEHAAFGVPEPTGFEDSTPEPNEQFSAPTTPQLSAPMDSGPSFPSLGLPDFSEPQLDDSINEAEPLRNSANPFQSQ